MTNADREQFAILMLGLGETYAEPVSEARMEIYFRALAEFPLDDVRAAVDTLVRTAKFFPRPAEIRDAMNGSLDDQSELAWVGLLQLVRKCGYWWNEKLQGPIPWPDDATKRAALDLYGGWQRLCELLPGEGPGLAVASKQFKATYRAYAARELREALPAPTVTGVLTDGR